MNYKINHANIKDWARDYNGEPFDAILCDPPYEISFMNSRWDASGIAHDKDMWADLLRILKPGGHLLAFSGSRTYHRMACAIEDAGFEIRDMIEWVYGSGFPKSLNIGKALDKQAGEEREVISGTTDRREDGTTYGLGHSGVITSNEPITPQAVLFNGYGTALKPAHEPCVLARKPIEGTVAQNALKYGTGGINIDGSRVEFVNEKDKGDPYRFQTTNGTGKHGVFNASKDVTSVVGALGRFPANLIHDGSDEVVGLFPDTKSGGGNKATKNADTFLGTGFGGSDNSVWKADSGSAARFFMTCKDTQKHAIMNIWNDINVNNAASNSTITLLTEKIVNITSALRHVPLNTDLVNHSLNAFFVGERSKSTEIDFVAKLVAIKEAPEGMLNQQELKVIQDFMQNSGNSTQTQNHVSGVENKDNTDITQITVNLLKLCGYVLHAIDESTKQANQENDNGQATETGFLYTAKASKSERNAGLEGFKEVIRNDGRDVTLASWHMPQNRSNTPKANHHPTVKPLSLTKYLATLIKPPTGGRLLVPFSGSGSEIIGALQAGWEYVEGVELTEEYIPIAEARIKYWLEKKEPE